MKLTLYQTLEKIRDESLGLSDLEALRDSLIHYKTDLLQQESRLKKAKALFLMQEPDKSAAARKMEFDVTPEGQKLFEVVADLRGLPDEISGLLSRIFSKIR